MASLRGRGRAESLALYSFLILAADAVAQIGAPFGWPAWPLLALIVAALAVGEAPEVASGAAALAAGLAVADAAKRDFAAWPQALAAVLGYAALVAAVHHAEKAQKRRLSRALDQLDRLRHGVEDLERPLGRPDGAGVVARVLREVSGEGRRARQVDRAAALDETLGRIVRLARTALRAHAVVYFDFDHERERAHARAADGPPTLQADASIPLRADPVAFVLDRGQPFYVTDYPKLLFNLPYYRQEEKIGTLLAVPVRQAGALRGALVAERLEIQSLGGDEAALLEAFADLVGETIHGSQRDAARDELTTEFKAIYDVSRQMASILDAARLRVRLLTCARDLLNPDAAAVIVLDKRRPCYRVQNAIGWAAAFEGREVGINERTFAAWVLRQPDPMPVLVEAPAARGERMPVLVLDEETSRSASILIVALRTGNVNLGALVLTGRPGTFDAAAQRVLTILANQVAGALWALQETENAQVEARHDVLTGLQNRRAFVDDLERTAAVESRRGGRFALLALDIDHFKRLNDTFGHPAGDAALQNTARLLKGQLRRGDLAARIGGEEFAVLLAGADEPAAGQIAERIRADVEGGHLVFGGARLSVTVSLGLAVWPDQTPDPAELMALADRALYAAKQGGRNRVALASALPPDAPAGGSPAAPASGPPAPA